MAGVRWEALKSWHYWDTGRVLRVRVKVPRRDLAFGAKARFGSHGFAIERTSMREDAYEWQEAQALPPVRQRQPKFFDDQDDFAQSWPRAVYLNGGLLALADLDQFEVVLREKEKR